MTLQKGEFYELREDHPRRKYKKVQVRAFRYEGEAPGPKPTGWFLDLDTSKFHAFRLADMVESTATRVGSKGRTRSGKRKKRSTKRTKR